MPTLYFGIKLRYIKKTIPVCAYTMVNMKFIIQFNQISFSFMLQGTKCISADNMQTIDDENGDPLGRKCVGTIYL